MVKIVLAADHAGFELKEKLKKFLAKDFELLDLTPKLIEGDDYPDVAFRAGAEVVKTSLPGVLICGSGEGMCIASNKIKGVRAALAYDVESAVVSKKHNNSNIICLAGRKLNEKDALRIVRAWLSSEFEGERHARRVEKISKFEK